MYSLTKGSVAKSCSSEQDFRVDEIPKQYRSTNYDYTSSAYDRGHMAPRASIDFNCDSEVESVLYSNASPQVPGLNRYGWKTLEEYVRKQIKSRGELFVIAGAIFHSDLKIHDRVTVPSHFYKVIYDPARKESIAYLFPNNSVANYDVHKKVVPILILDN